MEFVDNFDILAGAKLMNVEGNAFVNQRNRFNLIENFNVVNYDFTENTLAAGLRYRFNDDNIISAQFQRFNINHQDDALVDYGISQFNFLFSSFF